MEKLLIKVPVSLEELVDKITILRIKQARMTDAEKKSILCVTLN